MSRLKNLLNGKSVFGKSEGALHPEDFLKFLQFRLPFALFHPPDVLEFPLQGREFLEMRDAERIPLRLATLQRQKKSFLMVFLKLTQLSLGQVQQVLLKEQLFTEEHL